jgi:hypothetical protein
MHQKPVRFLAALAASKEARLRLALIPLLLQHPEFSAYVRSAIKIIEPSARVTLQCYYMAAYFLQRIYRPKLDAVVGEKAWLPDIFSNELLLACSDDDEINLEQLAERHKNLSGAQVNWSGTYHHAVRKWLASLERRQP